MAGGALGWATEAGCGTGGRGEMTLAGRGVATVVAELGAEATVVLEAVAGGRSLAEGAGAETADTEAGAGVEAAGIEVDAGAAMEGVAAGAGADAGGAGITGIGGKERGVAPPVACAAAAASVGGIKPPDTPDSGAAVPPLGGSSVPGTLPTRSIRA